MREVLVCHQFSLEFAASCLNFNELIDHFFLHLFFVCLILNDHLVHDALVWHHFTGALSLDNVIVQHGDFLEELFAITIFLLKLLNLGFDSVLAKQVFIHRLLHPQ